MLAEKLKVKVLVGELTNGDDTLRRIATVRTACNYLTDCISDGNKKVGIAWGKTVQEVIEQLPKIKTFGNVVFPLVGATNRDVGCYYTNKMVEELAKKTNSIVNYAMFPNYVSKEDCDLIKRTQAYKDICALWEQMDIAVVGIGNIKTVNDLRKNFDKKSIEDDNSVGDIVTHIFDREGKIISSNQDSLCVILWSVSNWCLTTLFDGEGSFKDIYIATCYSLSPLPIFVIISTILTNVMDKTGASMVSLLITFGFIWAILLLFFGTLVTHDYSLGKNFITILGTILAMAVIMFVIILFSSLVIKMVTFVIAIVKEIGNRM